MSGQNEEAIEVLLSREHQLREKEKEFLEDLQELDNPEALSFKQQKWLDDIWSRVMEGR